MQFHAVFDTSQDGLLILDDDLRFLEVNVAAAQLFGEPRDELIGRSADELPPLQHPGDAERVWAELAEHGHVAGEWELDRPDGSSRSVEIALRANFLPGRHIALMRDVTERKALEAQLRQAQKMEAVGRLAGGVAHDFNNLLTVDHAATASSCSPSCRPERAAARATPSEIDAAAERAAALTRQLLAFSRKQVLQPRGARPERGRRATCEQMLRRLIGEDIELRDRARPGRSARCRPTRGSSSR